jgi:hypothetical protein
MAITQRTISLHAGRKPTGRDPAGLRPQSMEAATGLLNSQNRKFVMAITARVLRQR